MFLVFANQKNQKTRFFIMSSARSPERSLPRVRVVSTHTIADCMSDGTRLRQKMDHLTSGIAKGALICGTRNCSIPAVARPEV